MKQIKNVLIIGVGGAGALAVPQFPQVEDFNLTRLVIDSPAALAKLKPTEDVTFLPLGSLKKSHGAAAPKSRERAERDFNMIRGPLNEALETTDGVVMFAGLGGVVGSVCALGIARLANDLRRPVVANLYLPFDTESTSHHAVAGEALQSLTPLCVFTCAISHAALSVVLNGETEVARVLNAVQALHVWHSTDVLRMVKWL